MKKCSPKLLLSIISSIILLVVLVIKNKNKNKKESFKSSPYPLPKFHNQIFQGHTKCREDIKRGIRPGNSPFRRRA
jgi:hypothetical protein